MIPWCHSVVTSWDYVGVGRVYVVLAPSWLWPLVFCWGASDSPPNPLLAQQQARACRCIKSRGSPKLVAGGVVTRPLVSPCWRAGLTCLGLNVKTLVNNGFLIPSYLSFMVSWFREIFTCYCRWVLVLGLVLVSWCYGVMTP